LKNEETFSMQSKVETTLYTSTRTRKPVSSSSFSSNLVNGLGKTTKVVLSGLLIGTLDAWQARYWHVGHLGEDAVIIYQGGFMIAATIAALVSLHESRWSWKRNAFNILLAIPIATIADNVSLDLQIVKPYIMILPRNGFLWRSHVFSHTIFFPLANWVDLQTFAPGLIDGYVAAVIIAVVYILVQFLWTKTDLRSMLANSYASFVRKYFVQE
jgi:hypothetical protein